MSSLVIYSASESLFNSSINDYAYVAFLDFNLDIVLINSNAISSFAFYAALASLALYILS